LCSYRNLVPIRTLNDEQESDVKNDTSDGEAKPHSKNAHFKFEGQNESEGQPDCIIANKRVDGSPHLQAQSSNDSTLHPMDRVEEDVHKEYMDDIVDNSHRFGFLGKQIGNLNLECVENYEHYHS